MRILANTTEKLSLLDALTSGTDASGHRYLEVKSSKSHKGPSGVIKLVYSVRYALQKGPNENNVQLVAYDVQIPTNSFELKRVFFRTNVKPKIEAMAKRTGSTPIVSLSPFSRIVGENKGVVIIR